MLGRSACSNLRVSSADFTALRLDAQVGVLLLPLPRQFIQVAHYFADVLHALRDAVGYRRGDGRLIVAEDEAFLLQNAEALRQHPRRNPLHLPPQGSKARGAICTQNPQNVHGPGPGQDVQQLTEGARRWFFHSLSHGSSSLGYFKVPTIQMQVVIYSNQEAPHVI